MELNWGSCARPLVSKGTLRPQAHSQGWVGDRRRRRLLYNAQEGTWSALGPNEHGKA